MKKRIGGKEEVSPKKLGRFGIQKILLEILANAGMLSVALLAPNAVATLSELPSFRRARGLHQRIERSIGALFRSGEIEWASSTRGKVLRLTKAGEAKLARLSLLHVKEEKRRWDQRWRLVIYDIRETHRAKRLLLQGALREIGFFRLQDSVWVYPHRCDELVVLLRTNFALGRDVHYLEVNHIENDEALVRHFARCIL